jgi:hypothetical protein
MTAAVDTRTVPVTLLRAGAAVLGAYSVVALLLDRREPVATIREWVNRPLGLGEDFGPLAVMLLLACTGCTGLTTRRLALVCLPAVAAVALSGLAGWTVPLLWVTALQALAWLVDRLGWPATVALLAAAGALCLFAADVPQLGRPLVFLPLVLVGDVTRRVLDRTLPTWAGALLGACCAALVVGADHAFPALDRWWYPVAATIAVLLFLTAVRVPGPTAAGLAAHPVARWVASSTEWVLLVGPVLALVVTA